MGKTLVVLAGPTAVGKTTCGITLAEALGTEIVSADSRQIYKETRIGTAVPSDLELARVPHHFIRCISLNQYYNASMYEQEVLNRLESLFRLHDVVLMVGGSGLYIDAVCQGIDDLPRIDPEICSTLHGRLLEEGLPSLASQLESLDPLSHRRIDIQNPMRVMKALEICIQTGKPYSSFLTAQRKDRPFRTLRFALDMDRSLLYERINRRVEVMMGEGLLEEVQSLLPFRECTAMKTVGYRELFRHLDGEISLDEAVDLIRRNTRKYARKQLTWFRKGGAYAWFAPEETKRMLDTIRSAKAE